jgi:hypothetical protein
MSHVALCLDIKGERVGIVLSAETMGKAVKYAETFKNRIGYVGETDFALAVKRAGMMERNEKNAWGVID